MQKTNCNKDDMGFTIDLFVIELTVQPSRSTQYQLEIFLHSVRPEKKKKEKKKGKEKEKDKEKFRCAWKIPPSGKPS